MTRQWTGWLAAIIVLMAQPAFAFTQGELDNQLALLMEWWAGEFDNNEQVVRQSGGGLSQPVFQPHFRVHSHYQRLDYPALGGNVFYVEEYKNDNPNDLYRIRLMSLHTDLEANGIRVQLYSPKDSQALVGSHSNLEKIAESPIEAWRPHNAGCTVFLNYEGTQFKGGMRRRGCIGMDPEGNEQAVWFDYHIVVGPEAFWFKDALRTLEDDRVVWELAPGSRDYYQADRVRWFDCVVNHHTDGDMTRTEKLADVSLHDQGGVAEIDYPGGRKLSLVLHNRAFATPTKNRFRILRLHEDGATVPIAYGYAGTETDRFGFNLGWFYTLCRPAGKPVG